jgi:DNA-binding response OmpR family regulator
MTAKSTVLVVEDDPAIRRGLADALAFAGYGVLECGEGD